MTPVTGPRPFPPEDPDCELCAAARFTHWYAESVDGWVADCEACSVPMVVWWHHGPEPDDDVVERLLALLTEAANQRFGEFGWTIDREMRQVPSHYHAHARDGDWWRRRWDRPMSRYTGVGGERLEGRVGDRRTPLG